MDPDDLLTEEVQQPFYEADTNREDYFGLFVHAYSFRKQTMRELNIVNININFISFNKGNKTFFPLTVLSEINR